METIILLILVTILIFVIKNNSDISLIKAQNELNHLNLERLRKRLENFEIKGEAEIQNVIDTNTETEKCPDINIGTQSSEKTVDNVPPITDNEEEKGLPTVPPFTPIAVNGDQPDSPDTDQCTPNEVSPDEEHACNPRKANWERLIGINIFSKIGILILITGVGFFVKYAIDKEWINEMTRTILGICAGFTLWGIAYRIRDDYRNFSSILAGGGFAICFLCIGIAFHLYSLFSATATFISLVALTLSMILISLKFDRAELAFISIIGGFVTPFISSDGNGSFLFVLGYMALLNTAMSAITIHKKWHSLPILSCWLTYIICIAGYISNEFREIYGWGLVAIIYYFILFTISLTVTLNRSQLRLRTVFLNLSAIILNSLAYLSLTTLLAEKTALLSHFDGCAGIIGAAINFGIYLRYYLNKEDGPASNLLIILIAGFSLATILIQFSNPNIYIAGIGLEAAIASWLYSYSGKRIFKIIALIIGLPLSCCLIHSVVFGYDSYDESWGYIVTAIAFTWSAYYNFIRQSREGKCCESILSSGALWAGATIGLSGSHAIFSHFFIGVAADGLTLLLTATAMSVILLTTTNYRMRSTYLLFPGSIAAVFALMSHTSEEMPIANLPLLLSMAGFTYAYLICGKDIFIRKLIQLPNISYYTIYFNLATAVYAVSVALNLLDISGLSHLHSAGVSIALTGCAAIEMALGMRYQNKLLRFISLGIFGIVIVKLLVFDLWRMAAIGRIIVFILLGVILLAVSFFYQRLRNVLIDKLPQEDK
ncbi:MULTISPECIES: DUF2339 domain-containing protein [Duncaniella]|uniref:DUF2339 domain-containing protein n=1 Tax=Duncaniella dubosii TaxID=2518971 RepID=A0A4P7W1E4_9BACT|nr:MULTISPECIES: DUF2339 domain-containing protein [Duncaniella]QCD41617.1 DUF2339 domain-containing protein [Duncaniella dubosii]